MLITIFPFFNNYVVASFVGTTKFDSNFCFRNIISYSDFTCFYRLSHFDEGKIPTHKKTFQQQNDFFKVLGFKERVEK